MFLYVLSVFHAFIRFYKIPPAAQAKIIAAKLKTKNPGHFARVPKRKLKNPILKKGRF